MSAVLSFVSFLTVIGLIVFFSMREVAPQQNQSDPNDTGTFDAIDSAKDAKNLIETRTQTEIDIGNN
jgi:hypothetical protein